MLAPAVLKKLDAIEARFEELTRQLSDPAFVSSGDRSRKGENEALLADKDPELREMAKEELAQLRVGVPAAEDQLKLYLVPKDHNDEKDVILEIRAGAGGDE